MFNVGYSFVGYQRKLCYCSYTDDIGSTQDALFNRNQ